MRIFANHAHIMPEEWRKNCGVAALKKTMEENGIEKAVCFAPFGYQMEKCADKNSNKFLYKQIKDDPSLVGFGVIDFERDDLTEQVEEIAGYGFKGIKIHPAAQEINIVGDKAKEVYAAAERLGLFISFHTGLHWYRIADYNPILFDEVAFFYPKLKFSMEHLGGYHFFRDGLAVMCNNLRNEQGGAVYAGWTSISMDDNGLPGFWSLLDEELKTVIHQTGDGLSIFGLDFPYRNSKTTKKDIDRIMNLDISDEAKEKILGKNLADALGIDW